MRGDSLAATLSVAANPRLVQRERDVVYVVGERAVTLVDPVALQVTGSIPLARESEALVDDGDWPTELALGPDAARAFILYGAHNKVVVLDLQAKKAIGSTKTGRGGKKLFGNMMGGMFGIAGFLAAGYAPWGSAGPRMLAVRPDGRYAYAINRQTKDVTVVDAATGKSVEMIGGSGYTLEVLAGGPLVLVSGSELHVIDTQRNVKAAEVPLSDLRGLFFPPDRSARHRAREAGRAAPGRRERQGARATLGLRQSRRDRVREPTLNTVNRAPLALAGAQVLRSPVLPRRSPSGGADSVGLPSLLRTAVYDGDTAAWSAKHSWRTHASEWGSRGHDEHTGTRLRACVAVGGRAGRSGLHAWRRSSRRRRSSPTRATRST